jgi:hypothetical protein
MSAEVIDVLLVTDLEFDGTIHRPRGGLEPSPP